MSFSTSISWSFERTNTQKTVFPWFDSLAKAKYFDTTLLNAQFVQTLIRLDWKHNFSQTARLDSVPTN